VTIENNGSLTHWANGTTAAGEVHKLNLTLTGLNVKAGGRVEVSSRGYAAGGYGPAGGGGGSGAGYGGQGSRGAGITYGSWNAPINLGSGGWDSAGGGAVFLNVSGTLQ